MFRCGRDSPVGVSAAVKYRNNSSQACHVNTKEPAESARRNSATTNLGLGIKHSELANYLNTKFPSRLSGKIVLDVEQNGEAYYINPKDLKGYFLNRPADAFRVMRDLGLGITNNDIRKIDVGEIK